MLLAGDASARPAGLERELARAGYAPVELEGIDTDPVALALVTLPSAEGAELAVARARTRAGANVPLVVILAAPDSDLTASLLDDGAADVLEPPVHLGELGSRLGARLRERKLGAESSIVRAVAPLVELYESQGVPLLRCDGYSDYYDTLPGGNARGRALEAKVFDANRLGSWKEKFRPQNFPVPARASESAKLMLMNVSWEGKKKAAEIGWRTVWGKLTGQSVRSAGASSGPWAGPSAGAREWAAGRSANRTGTPRATAQVSATHSGEKAAIG